MSTVHYMSEEDIDNNVDGVKTYCGLEMDQVDSTEGHMLDTSVRSVDIDILLQCPECAEHPRIQMETLALTKL